MVYKKVNELDLNFIADVGFVLNYIEDDLGSLKFNFTNYKDSLSFVFPYGVSSYRLIDNNASKINICLIDKNNKRIDEKHTFFKVINSDYIKSLVKTSYELYKEEDLENFMFYCKNYIVDIVFLKNTTYKIITNNEVKYE